MRTLLDSTHPKRRITKMRTKMPRRGLARAKSRTPRRTQATRSKFLVGTGPSKMATDSRKMLKLPNTAGELPIYRGGARCQN